ncbi:MAG: SpoIID/LytB domain-containing protein [Succiniclasticum sp.]|jgi:stage II sporulation protein D
MKHILWSVLFLCSLLWSQAVWAASGSTPSIDIGIVVSQYSAEIEAAAPVTASLPDGTKWTLEAGRYFFSIDGGKIRQGDNLYAGPVVLTPSAGSGKTGNSTKGKGRAKAAPSLLVNKQDCPGEVRIYVSDGGSDLTVVNRVPLELYVESVLGPKSSPVWPNEAIKAQAVAVRSLAWYDKQHQGNRLYAVRSVESGSFYGGSRTVNQAVAKVAKTTAGQVLYYNGSPAAAYSSESSGGRTVAASEVLGYSVPYLPSVQDYDQDCPGYQWEKSIPVSTISRLLGLRNPSLGKLTGYRLSSRTNPDERDRYASGRVRSLSWQGEKGSINMTGTEFADMLALSSNDFDMYLTEAVPDKLDIPIENGVGIEIGRKQMPIDVKEPTRPAWQSSIPGFHFLTGSKDEVILFKGRGIGTGLGLSKWGARGMAVAAGDKPGYYRTILSHYYPGTYLVTVYTAAGEP